MNSNYNQESFNLALLHDIAIYITNMLKIFGVIETNELIGFPTSNNSQNQNVELKKKIFEFKLNFFFF